jgi:hypothetical protein
MAARGLSSDDGGVASAAPSSDVQPVLSGWHGTFLGYPLRCGVVGCVSHFSCRRDSDGRA